MSDLTKYTHAMSLDGETGKPMPKTIIKRDQKTIKALDNVSISADGSRAYSDWIDLDGFSEVDVTSKADSSNTSTNKNQIDVYWSHDGVNIHATSWGNPSTSKYLDNDQFRTKARWIQLSIYNNDTVAHTFDSWIHAKS